MEFNWSILGWIVAVIVYFVGIYEGRGQGYKKRKTEEVQEKKEIHPVPIKPATITADDPGLMRIKSENGFLTLDLDGTRVNTSALSGDQRKRLVEMLTLIRPWLEGKPAPAPTTPSPLSQPMPSPALASGASVDSTQGRPVAPASTLSVPQKPLQPVAQQAAINPNTAPKTSTIAKEDRPAAPATSIVGQIDSVLQEQLAGTPLEERGIFLAQSPDGGVMVYVGLTKYMGIDDVPDA